MPTINANSEAITGRLGLRHGALVDKSNGASLAVPGGIVRRVNVISGKRASSGDQGTFSRPAGLASRQPILIGTCGSDLRSNRHQAPSVAPVRTVPRTLREFMRR